MLRLAVLTLLSQVFTSSIFALNNYDIDTIVFPFYKENLEAIVNISDQRLDPCVNFYQHACGNFKQFNWDEHTPPHLYDAADREDAFNFFRLNFTTNSGKKLNLLFESCKDNLKSKEAMMEELDFIKFLHGWPYLPSQWNKQEIRVDIPTLLGMLASGGYSVFLKVFFAHKTIYLGPDDIRPCNYKRIMKQWRWILGRHYNFNHLEMFSYEIFYLCKSLNAIARKAELNETTTDKSFLSGGKKLSDEFPNFEILKYFDVVTSRLNFTNTDLNPETCTF